LSNPASQKEKTVGQSGLSFDFRNKQKWDIAKEDVFYREPKGEEGAKLIKKGRDYNVNYLEIVI
jgi:hypothetical protein